MMKYARLTKEQFEALHEAFINFLATQSITKEAWEALKTDKPETVEGALDRFSDLVWEEVLNNARYLEHISPQQICLFSLKNTFMKVVIVRIKTDKDLTTKVGYDWLRTHLMDDRVAFFQSEKAYKDDKNLDKFSYIQQGAVITKGDLFHFFDNLINQ